MIFEIKIVSMITPIIIMKIFKSKHVLFGCMVYICFISKKIISWFFFTPQKRIWFGCFQVRFNCFHVWLKLSTAMPSSSSWANKRRHLTEEPRLGWNKRAKKGTFWHGPFHIRSTLLSRSSFGKPDFLHIGREKDVKSSPIILYFLKHQRHFRDGFTYLVMLNS